MKSVSLRALRLRERLLEVRGGEILSERARWHKNLENAATFSKFLGGRKNLSSAHMFLPAHKLAFAGDFYLYRK